MENKYIDKNTLDQAWNMMHTTLDQEMPVQKKRRALWWIPIGLALLTLVGLVYVFAPFDADANSQPQEQIQKTVVSKPIAIKETKSLNTTINQTEYSNKIEAKSIKNKELKTKSTFTPWLTKKNKAKSKIEAPLKSIDPNPKGASQNLMASNQMKTIVATEVSEMKDKEVQLRGQSLIQSDPSSKAVDVVQNASLAQDLVADSKQPSKLVNPLPILNNLQFDWENNTDLGIPVPKIRRWNIGLKTAVLSDVKINSPTLLVEGQIAKKIGTRWAIISGLGFKSQTLKFESANENFSSVQEGVLVGDLAFPGFDPNRGSTLSNTNSGGISSLLFNFLYIPIGMEYNFKGRWSLESGVHYNFLELSRGSSNSSRGGVQIADQDSNDLFANIRNYSQRNFNHFSYYLSLNYKLGKKASILVQYQGNTNRFNGISQIVDAHQFGLGMNWEL